MGRPDRQVDPAAGELARFAMGLRELRAATGSPTYRQLAQRANYSATTLSDAASGKKLPTLEVTLAYVHACQGNGEQWRARWYALAAELESARPIGVEPDPATTVMAPTCEQVAVETLEPTEQPGPAEQAGGRTAQAAAAAPMPPPLPNHLTALESQPPAAESQTAQGDQVTLGTVPTGHTTSGRQPRNNAVLVSLLALLVAMAAVFVAVTGREWTGRARPAVTSSSLEAIPGGVQPTHVTQPTSTPGPSPSHGHSITRRSVPTKTLHNQPLSAVRRPSPPLSQSSNSAVRPQRTTVQPIRYSFETSVSPWGPFWNGDHLQASVTDQVAFEGNHALQLIVHASSRPPGFGTVHIAGLTPGATVTFHVWYGGDGRGSLHGYAQDTQYRIISSRTASLTFPRAVGWTTYKWKIPNVPLLGLVFQLDTSGPGDLVIALDDVTW